MVRNLLDIGHSKFEFQVCLNLKKLEVNIACNDVLQNFTKVKTLTMIPTPSLGEGRKRRILALCRDWLRRAPFPMTLLCTALLQQVKAGAFLTNYM